MATKHIELTKEWQKITAAPCLIEARQGMIFIHFATTPPASYSKAYHIISPLHNRTMSYGGGENTYARAAGEPAQIIMTESV